MLNRPYSRELSADTSRIIIPTITFLTFMASLLQAIVEFRDDDHANWQHWVVALLAPLVGYAALRLVARGKQTRGINLFIGAYLAFLTLLLFMEWEPNNPLPYLYGVLIIVASMIQHPQAGLVVWGLSTVLILTVVGINFSPFSLLFVVQLMPPLTVNFLLALFSYLSATEWQFAVESVSDLHRKVQRRRDELFEMQEEIRDKNERLHATNLDLDAARQTAVTERDLRTRFMTNVSHELRTPINSIVNFAHIIAQGVRGPVTPEQADYLHRIERSGWHLLGVLNDLLDMAQIEAGEFKLYLAPTDLHGICEEALDSVQGLLLEKPITLERDFPRVWPLIRADRTRMRQALINLLGNAVKYTEEGTIWLRVQPQPDWVLVQVQDTGIGIDPAHHEVIFQEFRQIDESVARRRIGTGLGLPIARHLVERHEGTLTVESAVGEGSTFTMTLPIWHPPVSNGSQPATAALPAPHPEDAAA